MNLRFVVATHCNADCYFCLNEYIGSKSTDSMMLPAHYGNIMKIANNFGINVCTITGGEPTLRKDLFKILSEIRPYSKHITMVSNGYKLDRHLDSMPILDELHVSYHSMDEREWERITKVPDGAKKVRENLLKARIAAPKLAIKLNVVAEPQNSTPEEIEKYTELAKLVNAEITVFRESCSSLMKELDADDMILSEQSSELWNLEKLDGIVLKQNERQTEYKIKDVIIKTQLTSSEKASYNSCWVTPMGQAFVDTRQRSKLVDFMPSLLSDDELNIRLGILSLLNEANIMKTIDLDSSGGGLLDQALQSVLKHRNKVICTGEPIPVTNLSLRKGDEQT